MWSRMSEHQGSPPLQADVPWGKLWVDVVLVAVAIVVLVLCLIIDVRAGRADWFPRSGAIVVLIAGLLGYRSLTRHYRKFFNNAIRGYPLATSLQQTVVDCSTVMLSIIGTLVWGYGDKAF